MKEILANPGKPFQISLRMRHKLGHYIWLEGMMTNMLHDESINAIVANMRDVTENKKAQDLLQASENRFRSIIEQFPYPVVTYTPGGDYTTANLAWEIMWQDKRENIKEYNIRQDSLMIASGLSQYVEKAFAGEVAISEPYLYDPTLIGQAGRKRWMQMTLYPLKNTDGEILEVILALQDVTPNKEAEEEIKTLNESLEKKVIERTAQLEAVNKELEAFTYSVSHDLRAPLRIIDGYTEILVSDYQKKLDEEAKRMFGIITGNVRKMGQLIDDLLNLSQTGRKELLLYPSDMNKLVQSVIDEQLSLNGEKPADIKIETLLPAKCDSGLLQQVWSNLISNAIKYSGKQAHPVVRISSFRQNGEIVYEIKDNGVGFDMKYAGQLFGVFQRLHKATEFEGTGVGLALVKRIVAKHNGRVWAESEPGKGATFFFSLPAL
jgi:PAS domain S-box-containing protein